MPCPYFSRRDSLSAFALGFAERLQRSYRRLTPPQNTHHIPSILIGKNGQKPYQSVINKTKNTSLICVYLRLSAVSKKEPPFPPSNQERDRAFFSLRRREEPRRASKETT